MPPDADVDAWLAARHHPKTDTKGNIASINPAAKAFVSLMFHRGAEIPGDHPELQGGGDVARYMRFESPADVASRRDALQAAVRAWCQARDAQGR